MCIAHYKWIFITGFLHLYMKNVCRMWNIFRFYTLYIYINIYLYI